MSVESLIGDVEAALARLIRLGLGVRLPAVGDVGALAALDVGALSPGELCPVTGSGLFEWMPYSSSPDDGALVVAPSPAPAVGRWHRVATEWTYGAGGLNLGAKLTGYLKAVEAYGSDDGPDAVLERVYGQTPSVLVQFTGDEPESIDMTPGAFYRNVLSFQLVVMNSNLRPAPATTQGSPDSGEAAADPGSYRTIGDIRRLLAGVAPDPKIPGVERIELGRVELGDEAENQRLFQFLMQVRVRASFVIEDEDLLDAWSIAAQPADTAPAPDAAAFDARNYVISGCGLVEGHGPGLSRTIETAIAKVDGAVVTASQLAVTLDADSDVYRDLDADGWHLTAVDAGASAPALADGRLRVAVTRTDGGGVLHDRELCSYSIAFGSPVLVAVTAS